MNNQKLKTHKPKNITSSFLQSIESIESIESNKSNKSNITTSMKLEKSDFKLNDIINKYYHLINNYNNLWNKLS